jgi:hypothetical protein
LGTTEFEQKRTNRVVICGHRFVSSTAAPLKFKPGRQLQDKFAHDSAGQRGMTYILRFDRKNKNQHAADGSFREKKRLPCGLRNLRVD